MTAREVSDQDSKKILAHTRDFIQKKVLLRKSEIIKTGLIPEAIRRPSKKMVYSDMLSPSNGAGPESTQHKIWNWQSSSDTRAGR
jgi:hypothetical protein